MSDIQVVFLATAATRAGCTQTTRLNGLAWSTRSDDAGINSLTVRASTITGTNERTGCRSPSDNLARSAVDSSSTMSATRMAETSTYQITGSQLVISGPSSSLTLTRQ